MIKLMIAAWLIAGAAAGYAAAPVPAGGAAAATTAATARTPRPVPSPRGPVTGLTYGTILPIGDSITHGYGSTSGSGYRPILDTLIRWQHTYVGPQTDVLSLQHAGYPGWRIDQLTPHARGWAATWRPEVALVHAGTNDAGAGDAAAVMIADLRALLTEIRAGSPSTWIIVAQIPPVPYNTGPREVERAAFDNAIPALAAEFRRVSVADMRAVHISVDRVHPDDAGYAAEAAQWAAVLNTRRAAHAG